MGLNFHIPLPGPFSYSQRIGMGRRPSKADLARAIAQDQRRRAERVERDEHGLVDLAERYDAVSEVMTDDELERLEASMLRLSATPPGTTRFDYHAAAVMYYVTQAEERQRTGSNQADRWASRRERADNAGARLNERADALEARLEAKGAEIDAHREHIAAGGNLRVVLAERFDALHGRVDTTELARLFGVLDAEKPGSWRWTRRAEELRRAIGKAERAARRG